MRDNSKKSLIMYTSNLYRCKYVATPEKHLKPSRVDNVTPEILFSLGAILTASVQQVATPSRGRPQKAATKSTASHDPGSTHQKPGSISSLKLSWPLEDRSELHLGLRGRLLLYLEAPT